MEMELFSVELGPSSLQGLLYLFKDEADICRFAATMGLIPRGGSVLQGALGSAGDCQTGGPDLSLIHISEPTRPKYASRMPSSA